METFFSPLAGGTQSPQRTMAENTVASGGTVSPASVYLAKVEEAAALVALARRRVAEAAALIDRVRLEYRVHHKPSLDAAAANDALACWSYWRGTP